MLLQFPKYCLYNDILSLDPSLHYQSISRQYIPNTKANIPPTPHHQATKVPQIRGGALDHNPNGATATKKVAPTKLHRPWREVATPYPISCLERRPATQ